MQIIGQGISLYLLDIMVRPAFAGSFILDLFLFLIKGMATYWVYLYFQCSDSGVIRHALSGLSFTKMFIGGLFGAMVLLFTGMIINENQSFGAGDVLFTYTIEAIILNMFYGIAGDAIQSAVKSQVRSYGS